MKHGLRPCQRRRPTLPRQHQRQGHVLHQTEVRQDVKGLKHKTDVVAPQRGAGIVVEFREVLAPNGNSARVGQVQAGHQVE